MVHRAGVVFGTIAIVSLMALWVVDSHFDVSPTKFILKQNTSLTPGDKISDIDAEFINGSVLLNIHTNQPMSCDEVKDVLGLKPITIKNRTYIAKCYSITDKLIQLIYFPDNLI